jgi:hypothetical protein
MYPDSPLEYYRWVSTVRFVRIQLHAYRLWYSGNYHSCACVIRWPARVGWTGYMIGLQVLRLLQGAAFKP